METTGCYVAVRPRGEFGVHVSTSYAILPSGSGPIKCHTPWIYRSWRPRPDDDGATNRELVECGLIGADSGLWKRCGETEGGEKGIMEAILALQELDVEEDHSMADFNSSISICCTGC